MGLFDKLRGELIDIIEWIDPSQDTMVYRFERRDNEIKYGAQLIVRESQVAVFINQGKLADVFGPGQYTLETENLPLLTTLLSWPYGFRSPFKAEVYFVSTRQFTDLKWGTKNPIMLRDPEFGPVRLRAFGTYCMQVVYAPTFLTQVVGTDGEFTKDQITDQLRNLIVARFADNLGESKIPVLDLAGNYDELGKFVTEKIADDFDSYGLKVTKLLVENISLPPEVEAMMDKRTSMGVIGNLTAYTQFQAANAMEKAADSPSGAAGSGMGLGMGFAMANQMAQGMGRGPATPPPMPQTATYFTAAGGAQAGPFDLNALRQQIQSGAVTRDTFVWAEGMPEWKKAADVADVARLFGATPPPAPPA